MILWMSPVTTTWPSSSVPGEVGFGCVLRILAIHHLVSLCSHRRVSDHEQRRRDFGESIYYDLGHSFLSLVFNSVEAVNDLRLSMKQNSVVLAFEEECVQR